MIFRTAGYTHRDGGFNATHQAIMPLFPKLTEEERWRSTFALVPPTLCFGTAPDQCFFFLVRPTGPETIDVEIGYLFHPSALEDPLFEHKLQLSDVGVQVFVQPGPGRHHQGPTRSALPLRTARPLLVAGGEPRPVQPLARAALPPALAGGRRHRTIGGIGLTISPANAEGKRMTIIDSLLRRPRRSC